MGVLRNRLITAAYATILTGLFLFGSGFFGLGTGTVEAVAGPGALRDPFASRPMGPFSLLTNPATIVEEHDLRLHVGFQPDENRGSARYIAVSEPGSGLGAGALIWFDGGGKAGAPKWRQISYTVGQFIADRVAFGASVKHVKSADHQRWAGDLGLYFPVERGLQIGLVYYNVFGATHDNPREIAASVSLVGRQGWALSVEVGGRSSSSGEDSVLAWALDVPLGPQGLLRAGHQGSLGEGGQGAWLAGLRWTVGRFGFDMALFGPSGETVRYRFGLSMAF